MKFWFCESCGKQLSDADIGCGDATDAPCGETPNLSWDWRDRISAIGALTVSPRRQRLNAP